MTLNDQINAAIGAHGLWKGRLKDAIRTGRSDVPVHAVSVDNQCAFGKWLQSFDAEGRKSPNYKTCYELHRRFHVAAGDVLALALAGKRQEAERALADNSAFVNTSRDLIRAMMTWAAAKP